VICLAVNRFLHNSLIFVLVPWFPRCISHLCELFAEHARTNYEYIRSMRPRPLVVRFDVYEQASAPISLGVLEGALLFDFATLAGSSLFRVQLYS
jgi:hypothetical protein